MYTKERCPTKRRTWVFQTGYFFVPLRRKAWQKRRHETHYGKWRWDIILGAARQANKKSIQSCHMICWVTNPWPVQWFFSQVMKIGQHNIVLGTFEFEFELSSAFEVSLSHHNLSKTRVWQIHHHPQTHNNTSNKNDFLVFIAGLHQIQCHHANSVACPHFFFLLILLIFSSFPLYYYTHHSDANLTPPNMDLMTLDPIRPTNCCTSLDNLYRESSIICGESDFVCVCYV